MKTILLEAASNRSKPASVSFVQKTQFEFILRQVDLIATVIALLGIFLLGLAAVVLAVVELARLISNHWTGSVERWLMVTLGIAIIWVVVRWKKSSHG